MAQNMPQKFINLGKWKFVCFVSHTQMIEQRLYGMHSEFNCNIIFLVTQNDTYRLMGFKSNPWMSYDEEIDPDDFECYKQSIFLFNGYL